MKRVNCTHDLSYWGKLLMKDCMRKAQEKKIGEMKKKSMYASHKVVQSNMHTKYDRHKRRREEFWRQAQEEYKKF